MKKLIDKGKVHTHRLLRKSEKYFKTDMVYLAKGGFWMTLGQFMASITAFVLSIAFANLVSQETYGTYKYILSIAGVLSAITLTGLGTAVTQAVAHGREKIVTDAFWINLKWSAGFIVTTITLSFYYFYQENSILGISIIIIGVGTPVINGFNIFASYLNGKKKFKEVTLYWAILNTASSLCIISALFLTKNILALISVYFVSYATFGIYFYSRTIRLNKPNNTPDPMVITYAKHLSAMNILGTVAMHIDKVLVFHYLGTAQLAIYAFAIAIPEQIRGLLKQINTIAFPKFATRTNTEIYSNMPIKMLYFGGVISIIVVAYILVAPFLFKIVFPQYTAAVFYSQIFAISLIGTVATLPISVLQAKSETEELYKLTIFTGLTQIVAMFIGIYFFGLLGLIIARIAVRFIATILSYTLLRIRYAK